MTEGEARRGGGWRRWYYERAQWLVFPLALAANGLNYVRKGWRHLIRALRDPDKRKTAHWIDLAALIFHQVVYLGVPMFFFSARDVVGFYALRLALLGYAMFAALAPGHFPAEAARLAADQKDADYLLLQTSGTTNFRAGRIGSFFVSGLDYQIEHHLFPNVSHVHYRGMSVVVKNFCRENGLPYRVFRWDHILWKCWMTIRWPRPVVADAESLRLPLKERAREMAAQSSPH
jgi:fatty acid desaturase